MRENRLFFLTRDTFPLDFTNLVLFLKGRLIPLVFSGNFYLRSVSLMISDKTNTFSQSM